MAPYYIYTIGGDGNFTKTEIVECADDKDAIEKAKLAANDRDVEVWEHTRFVGFLPGHRAKESASRRILGCCPNSEPSVLI
jgi:hypothetical protein